jgi:hypothetical protein
MKPEIEMRAPTLLLTAVAILLGGLLFAPDARADKKITEQQVKDKCGNKLVGGGGTFGCSLCSPGKGPFGSSCTDYSCNDNGQGGARTGCWKTPIKAKTAPQGTGKGTKGIGNPVTGVKGAGTSGWKDQGPSGFKPAGVSGSKSTGPSGFVRRK